MSKKKNALDSYNEKKSKLKTEETKSNNQSTNKDSILIHTWSQDEQDNTGKTKSQHELNKRDNDKQSKHKLEPQNENGKENKKKSKQKSEPRDVSKHEKDKTTKHKSEPPGDSKQDNDKKSKHKLEPEDETEHKNDQKSKYKSEPHDRVKQEHHDKSKSEKQDKSKHENGKTSKSKTGTDKLPSSSSQMSPPPENKSTKSHTKAEEKKSSKQTDDQRSQISLIRVGNNSAKALEAGINAIQKTINSFAISLYKALSKLKNKANVIVSTTMIRTVVGLGYCGAVGQTKKEILQFFKLPDEVEVMTAAYSAFLTRMKQSCIGSSSLIAVDERYDIYDEFIRLIKKNFGVQVVNHDFRNDREGGIDLLNSIIKERTGGYGEDTINDKYLPVKTSIMLVDVSYFRTKWNIRFSPEGKAERKFYVNENQFVNIDMLHVREQFFYLHHTNLKAKILEVPIDKNNYSMFLILPDEMDEIETVESNLNKFDLTSEIFSKLVTNEVDVTIPEFTLSQTIDLRKLLISSGVKELFDETEADLSNVSDQHCYVNRVLLRSSIDVNEEGLQTASPVDVFPRSSETAEIFLANHPFIFVITKNDTSYGHVILFIGKFGYIITKDDRVGGCCDKCTCSQD